MARTIIPSWMQPMHDTYHFAPAVIDGDHLRCSGMIGLRPDLTVSENLTEQFTQAFENLRDLLGEVGLGFADVTEMTTYHVGLAGHIEEFCAVKDAFISAPYPAWTAVGISELASPGAAVEIRITARLR